jgi:F-type H+-transporting ATPase subunit epsilon
MKLRITTPLAVVVDADNIGALRAEDASGSFGILPGHAEFLTALTVSVIAWSDARGNAHYCAVKHGVLSVNAGREIAVATREAIEGDSLEALDQTVLARFRADLDAERVAHVESALLQLAAVRQLMRYLHPDGQGGSMFT